MKYLPLFILVILSPNLYAQESTRLPVNQSGMVEFTKVITVDSVTGKELYSRARLFVANSFRDSKEVTQLEDAESLTLVTKGLFPRLYTWPMNKNIGGNVRFKFTIQCKDGRFRYSVSDLVHEDTYTAMGFNYSGGPLGLEKAECGKCMTKKTWDGIKSKTSKDIQAFLVDLEKSMTQQKTADNW